MKTHILFLFLALGIYLPAKAQPVCLALAQNLKQDVLQQGSANQQLRTWQTLVSDEKFKDYAAANSTKIATSLSVVDVVYSGLGIGGTGNLDHDEKNWETDRSKFLSLSSVYDSSAASSSTKIEAASAVAYQAIVDCAQVYANALGVFGVFSASTHEAFTIKINHRDVATNAFNITSFNVVPRDAVSTCSDAVLDATAGTPVHHDIGEWIITCQKVPDRAVTISVNTSGGALGPYIAASSRDDIEDLRSQLAAGRSSLLSLKEQNTALQSALQTYIGSNNARIGNIGHSRSNCHGVGDSGKGATSMCAVGEIAVGATAWRNDSAILTYIQCCPLE